PNTTIARQNLGAIYQVLGRLDEAEREYTQALSVRRRVLGPKHPDCTVTLNSLASLADTRGQADQAAGLFRQALDVARENLELSASGQSDRQQMINAQRLRYYLDGYLSVLLRAKMNAEPAYDAVLRWKGAVFVRQRRMRTQRNNPELRDLFDRHRALND